MGEGRGSTLVHLLVVILCLIAFGFSIAAERRRSTQNIPEFMWSKDFAYMTCDDALPFFFIIFAFAPKPEMACLSMSVYVICSLWLGIVHLDEVTNTSYCAYKSDVATGYGVGGFLFLLSGQSLLMGVTKCMCFGRPLTPGGDRAWAIIYFVSSWATFLVAEACLIAGATKNAYHTKYRGMIYAQNLSCEALRKGVFIAGAVFVVATMVLNVYFYMYFIKATTKPVQKANPNRASSTVGMTGYP